LNVKVQRNNGRAVKKTRILMKSEGSNCAYLPSPFRDYVDFLFVAEANLLKALIADPSARIDKMSASSPYSNWRLARYGED